MRSLQKRRGFTLVELMVTVAIVAILATVAYPSYVGQVRKSRRAEAKTALLDLATRQEQHFSAANTYTDDASALGLGAAFPLDVVVSGGVNYRLVVVSASAAGFVAAAQPVGDQVNDGCGSYLADQLGRLTNQDNTIPTLQCW